MRVVAAVVGAGPVSSRLAAFSRCRNASGFFGASGTSLMSMLMVICYSVQCCAGGPGACARRDGAGLGSAPAARLAEVATLPRFPRSTAATCGPNIGKLFVRRGATQRVVDYSISRASRCAAGLPARLPGNCRKVHRTGWRLSSSADRFSGPGLVHNPSHSALRCPLRAAPETVRDFEAVPVNQCRIHR
jgi:hypothetical protein